jgi:L-seryl-tRNA(Ser) seleniumtransferase
MSKDKQDILRSLPGIDDVLKNASAVELVATYGRSSVVAGVRNVINSLRDEILSGSEADVSVEKVLSLAGDGLASGTAQRLKRVINATGIILHTGLGRAYMPDAVRDALVELTGYCNIQMDLSSGERIKREECISDLVRDLTGAEDAVLVNNNAGATMLVLKALAEEREVVVSRGELIEIGGSFRLPEIMEQSGAVLREVGSTNKTHLKDYKKAISDKTALLLKAHKSNYCIVGFTKEVTIGEIAELGKENGVLTVDDLGCGALVDLEQFGLGHEMTARESLEAGADIVLFSTDKLIGGPQGGMIVGRADLLKTIRSHPLYRALRVGKMTLAALEATLRLFKSPEHLEENHPLYVMISKAGAEMKIQAEELAEHIKKQRNDWQVDVVEDPSYLGGGSLPGTSMPAFAVRITSEVMSAEDISQNLRSAEIPVVTHVNDGAVLLNTRTVSRDDHAEIITACRI